MKKFVYSILTLAGLFAMASCQLEQPVSPYGADTVSASFTVDLGDLTKAYADGTKADRLQAGLYERGQAGYTYVDKVTDAEVSGKAGTIAFNGKLEKGKEYVVAFWAQDADCTAYALDWGASAPVVTVTPTGNANDDTRDAFFGIYETGVVSGNITATSVTLKRPFAQVNVMVPVGNVTQGATIRSNMTVAQAPTTLNLITKATGTPADYVFAETTIAEDAFGDYAGTHIYAAMNYVLVDQTAQDPRYDVTVDVKADAEESGDKTVASAPLRPNVRTNIVGNVFSNSFGISVPVTIGSDPAGSSDIRSITVLVGGNEPDPAGVAVAVGGNQDLTPSYPGAQSTVTAVSSDVSVATVSVVGQTVTVHGVANGTATITIVVAEGTKSGTYAESSTSVEVVIGTGVNRPVFDPAAGEVAANTEITITTTTDGASIYYTEDGTDPTSASTLYSAQSKPTVNAAKTIKAVAIKGGNASDIVSAAYTVTVLPQVATPTFSPEAGAVAANTEIAISTTTDGASIYYTVDGTAPTSGSTLYNAQNKPTIDAAKTIKAIAIKDGMTDSAVAEAAYTIAAPAGKTIAELKVLMDAGQDGAITENVTLGEVSVTYVKNSNAYIEDATGGMVVYKSGHGLIASKTYTGIVVSATTMYNTHAYEITGMDASGATSETLNALPVTELSLATVISEFAKYQYMRVRVVGVTTGAAATSSNKSVEVTQNTSALSTRFDYLSGQTVIKTESVLTMVGYPNAYSNAKQFTVMSADDVDVTTEGIETATIQINNVNLAPGESVDLSTLVTVTPAAAAQNLQYAISNNANSISLAGSTVSASGGAQNDDAATITLSIPRSEGNYTAAQTSCTVTVATAPGIPAGDYIVAVKSGDDYIPMTSTQESYRLNAASPFSYTSGTVDALVTNVWTLASSVSGYTLEAKADAGKYVTMVSGENQAILLNTATPLSFEAQPAGGYHVTAPDAQTTRYLSKNNSGAYFAFYANTGQNATIYLIPANVAEQVATPVITGANDATVIPAQGSLSVTITCATPGATIHYTTNGDVPTTNSATYSAALSLENACTVKAIAVKDGMVTSEMASQAFTKAGAPVLFKTFTATSIGSGYGVHTNVSSDGLTWTVTFGQNTYVGTNSSNKANCKLGDTYAKVGTPCGYDANTTQVAAIISESTLADIIKVVVDSNSDNDNYCPEKISLVYSTDNTTYSLVETQDYSKANGNTFNFAKKSAGYYAVVIYYSGSNYMRTNNLQVKFYK